MYQLKKTSVTTIIHVSLPALYCVGYTTLTGNSPVSGLGWNVTYVALYYSATGT